MEFILSTLGLAVVAAYVYGGVMVGLAAMKQQGASVSKAAWKGFTWPHWFLWGSIKNVMKPE